MNYKLWIAGNQTDPDNGNPIPWQAMSQRSKWTKPAAARYIAWKKYIQGCWLEKFRQYPYFDGRQVHRLDIHCVYKKNKSPDTKCVHADSTNVRKGVEDALFGKFTNSHDQHVWGMTTFDHGFPTGVQIEVFGPEEDKRGV